MYSLQKQHDLVNVHLCFKSGKHKQERPCVDDRKDRHLNVTNDAHAAVVLTEHTKQQSVFCEVEKDYKHDT